jgi:hypothetical protein
MFTDIAFYAAALPAVALAGLSKGGFGGAMGMLAVPVLALVISPIQAAGIMLPILLVMDGISLFFYRRIFDRRTLVVMLPASIVGITVGWMTAAYVKEDFVRLLVGVISILFALNYWFGDRLRAKPMPPNSTKGAFWGTLAGFTSFVSHAGAPPFQMYALPLGDLLRRYQCREARSLFLPRPVRCRQPFDGGGFVPVCRADDGRRDLDRARHRPVPLLWTVLYLCHGDRPEADMGRSHVAARPLKKLGGLPQARLVRRLVRRGSTKSRVFECIVPSPMPCRATIGSISSAGWR